MKKGRLRQPFVRAAHQYKHWLKADEEIAYPRCFYKQLGVCAALFLVLFGCKQIEAQPVQAALNGIRSVATTETELDPMIGKLEFVGNFVPESVMVFWNAGEKKLSAPFEEAVLLNVEEGKGTALFEGGGAVLSGGEGVVKAVEKTAEGYRLTVRYDNGLIGVFQPLSAVRVGREERVHEGQSIGTALSAGDAAQITVQVLDGHIAQEPQAWLR